MEAKRNALAAYIRAGIDGPRKQRRVFQNRLQECFPCRNSISEQRKQARLIEEFARENSWSVRIHDMGVSVTFQGPTSDGQALQRAVYGHAEIQLLDESGNVAETIQTEIVRGLV